MDEIRKERPPLNAATPSFNWVAGGPVHERPNGPENRARGALDNLIKDYQFHVERVGELNDRLAQAIAERDGARERAGQYDVDRHTEQLRADRLQRDVDNHTCQVRSGHVCTERCKPNRHVAFEGRHRLHDAEERADKACAALTRVEERLGREVIANAKLADQAAEELGARRETERQLHEAHARIRDLESEREGLISGRRADHAEIVKLREDRDVARKVRDETINRMEIVTRERDEAVIMRDRFEAELVARPLRESLAEAWSRNAELQGWLTCRENRQRAAEAEVSTLRLTLDRIQPSITKIEHWAMAEAVDKALDPDTMDHPDYQHTTRDLARNIRSEIRRLRSRTVGAPDSTWDGPTCGEQCRHEGSPGSPTE